MAILERVADTTDPLEAAEHLPHPAYGFPNLPFVTTVEQLRRAGWTGAVRLILVGTAQKSSARGDTAPIADVIARLVTRHAGVLDSGSGDLVAEVATLSGFGVEAARVNAIAALARHPDAVAVFASAGSGAKQLSIGTALGALTDPRFAGLLLPSQQDAHVRFSLRLDPLPWLLRTGAFAAAADALPEDAPAGQREVLHFLAARAQGMAGKEQLLALRSRRPDLVSDEAYSHLLRLHGALAFAGLVRARAGEPVGAVLLRAWLEAACERDTGERVPPNGLHHWLYSRVTQPPADPRLSWVTGDGADPNGWTKILAAGKAGAHENALRGRPVPAAARLLERHAAARSRTQLADGLLELELVRAVGLPLSVPREGPLLIHPVGRQEVAPEAGDPLPFVTALAEDPESVLPATVALVASTSPQPVTGYAPTLPLAERAAERWRELGVDAVVVEVDLADSLLDIVATLNAALTDRIVDEVTVTVGPGDSRIGLAALLAGARAAGRQAATVSLISLPQLGTRTQPEHTAQTALSALGHDAVLVQGALELVQRLAPVGAHRLLETGSARVEDLKQQLRRFVERWRGRDVGRAQVELIARQQARLGELAAVIAMYAELEGHEHLTREHQALKGLRNDVLHDDVTLAAAARRRKTTVRAVLAETLDTLPPLSPVDDELIRQWEDVRAALVQRDRELSGSTS